jgi:hypothetical protein
VTHQPIGAVSEERARSIQRGIQRITSAAFGALTQELGRRALARGSRTIGLSDFASLRTDAIEAWRNDRKTFVVGCCVAALSVAANAHSQEEQRQPAAEGAAGAAPPPQQPPFGLLFGNNVNNYIPVLSIELPWWLTTAGWAIRVGGACAAVVLTAVACRYVLK